MHPKLQPGSDYMQTNDVVGHGKIMRPSNVSKNGYTSNKKCLKCENHFNDDEMTTHLEDVNGDAVEFDICKSCYSDYPTFCDFMESNGF